MRLQTLVACLTVISGAALAQEQQTTTSAQSAGWTSRCVSAARGGPAACSVEQSVILQEGNRRLLTIRVDMPEAPRTATMLFQAPLGILLPAGLSLQVDKAQPLQLELQSCDPNGCYASVPLGDPLLALLISGASLRVGMQSTAREPITIDIPLAGFTAAYERIR